ncbi:hypothetical protein Pmani_006737 [Petrolisthes manimaculis]|uniref:Nuclear receptor-binding factor 2 MIT domain-containing protein n=1 Tax=Petrolisthes manimaculis TaxID=1843537 RepID=A0AAE1QC95_9EUCA|nr:hypothetical protein Pmani_006737 [Petrolisthes manimaculis]
MDNSPLNKAHREQRRAESCCRSRRLEEAAECHGRAAELLTAALALTSNTLARQSITLQHSHHLRQQELLRFRSKQLEKYVKAMENQRMKMGSGSGSSSGGGGSGSACRELPTVTTHVGKKAQAITLEMTRNTEKFESLLSLLIPEETSGVGDEKADESKSSKKLQDDKQLPSAINSPGKGEDLTMNMKDGSSSQTKKAIPEDELKRRVSVSGVKKEKDMMVIVEELRTLRDHQADLITQLMTDLSFLEKENSQLKYQVRDLQDKCEQFEGERRRMRAMADSSCSPFVFSPLSEFSPDAPSGVLDLAPLEMPPLDFLDGTGTGM